MEEIYGENEGRRRPMASETQYYEKMRNERNDQFAPNYTSDPKSSFYSEAYLAKKAQESGNGGAAGNYNNASSSGGENLKF